MVKPRSCSPTRWGPTTCMDSTMVNTEHVAMLYLLDVHIGVIGIKLFEEVRIDYSAVVLIY
jgi:hypothetical protein